MTRCVRLQVAAFALVAIALGGRVAAADATADQLRSPVGVWKTIDDKTGKDRALVRIYEQDQKFFARIEHVLTPGDEARICDKCRDERRISQCSGWCSCAVCHGKTTIIAAATSSIRKRARSIAASSNWQMMAGR